MRRSVAIKKMHYIQFTIVKWTFDPYTCVIFQCSEWFYILFSHFLIPHIYKEHYRSKKTTTKNFAQKVLPPMCETTVQPSVFHQNAQIIDPLIFIILFCFLYFPPDIRWNREFFRFISTSRAFAAIAAFSVGAYNCLQLYQNNWRQSRKWKSQ